LKRELQPKSAKKGEKVFGEREREEEEEDCICGYYVVLGRWGKQRRYREWRSFW
jgi:hypothetical protein